MGTFVYDGTYPSLYVNGVLKVTDSARTDNISPATMYIANNRGPLFQRHHRRGPPLQPRAQRRGNRAALRLYRSVQPHHRHRFSGNSQTGTLQGTAAFTSGKINGAILFNGSTNSGITVPDAGGLYNSSANFSVSAWVMFYSFPVSQSSVAIKDGTVSPYGSWRLGTAAGPDLVFTVYNSPVTWPTAYSNFAPVTNVWYHLVGVFSGGSSVQLYVNGSNANTTSATFSGSLVAANTVLAIGYDHQSPTTTMMNGIVDDVRFYNRALSAAEILNLYSDTSGD